MKRIIDLGFAIQITGLIFDTTNAIPHKLVSIGGTLIFFGILRWIIKIFEAIPG